MALWTWWPGDALPELARTIDVRAAATADVDELASLTGLAPDEVRHRLEAGHRPYVARVDDQPTAYGWVATVDASIGELGIGFDVNGSDRYLWDFATLPAWRGRGLYPHLLQEIIGAERRDRRFWIINAPENVASARGIAKAGFADVGTLAFSREGGAAIAPTTALERARAGAAILGVPVVASDPSGPSVSPCWGCVSDALARGARESECWPARALERVVCTCSAPAAA